MLRLEFKDGDKVLWTKDVDPDTFSDDDMASLLEEVQEAVASEVFDD